MLPEARRRRTRAPEQRVRTFEKRAGTGEKKGCKRMAETGAVFDVAVPDGPPRTPEQIMRPDPAGSTEPPRAQNRWYTCDITASRDVTAGKIFDQADRRDPGRLRTWIALLDGDNHQLGLFQAQAAARGVTLAIVRPASTTPSRPRAARTTSSPRPAGGTATARCGPGPKRRRNGWPGRYGTTRPA